MPFTLYHRTTHDAACAILREGFRDGEGTYGFVTVERLRGVWFSNEPVDASEGAKGDHLLEVRLSADESDLAYYEVVEEGKGCREWFFPSEILRSLIEHIRLVEDDSLYLGYLHRARKAARRATVRVKRLQTHKRRKAPHPKAGS